MNKLSASGGTPYHPLSRENCASLVLQLRVSIFKTNNLQKKKGFPRSVRMIKFQCSKFLQVKPQNAINFQKFIFTFHSQTEKFVEIISTSYDGKLKHAMVQCLKRWIPNPGVPGSKPLVGSKVDSAFHPSKGDQLSTKNSWKPEN